MKRPLADPTPSQHSEALPAPPPLKQSNVEVIQLKFGLEEEELVDPNSPKDSSKEDSPDVEENKEKPRKNIQKIISDSEADAIYRTLKAESESRDASKLYVFAHVIDFSRPK